MLALIKKDLVTSRQPILIVIGLWVVQWITVLRLENLMTVSTFATMVLPLLIFGTDTSANGDILTCSLPVRRASVVKARYLVSAMLLLTGLGVTWILATVTRAVAPELAASKGIEMTRGGVLGFVTVVAVMLGLLYPFLFRSGFRRGIIQSSIAIAGLFAALTGVEYLVSLRRGYEMFRVTPFSGIATGVLSALEPIGSPGLVVLASALVVAWIAGSMALSVRLFARREF